MEGGLGEAGSKLPMQRNKCIDSVGGGNTLCRVVVEQEFWVVIGNKC